MDTLILLLILVTFCAMRGQKRWQVYLPFFASLIATFLLFLAHASSSLDLNF
ncbi:DUF5993 family protein [Blastopirellula sp. J2-11]|uniref:DUF5993 family protein n=1 Tax=Blastopirellula sp. J2-11 TaxID=2943192 RepID=UPI0021CA7975|nr:DUF5993 family protein [Blastopirellula sp. J2-11]UUO06507.1 DUF5993 family protein [Blastopirellula sp. J2-11]